MKRVNNSGILGKEFGSTTGRPRRCGWLDLVALKYSLMLNGVTQLIMTKTDVLDTFETIKVATAYSIDGELTDRLPYDLETDVKPVFTPNYLAGKQTLPGFVPKTSSPRNSTNISASWKKNLRYPSNTSRWVPTGNRLSNYSTQYLVHSAQLLNA